MNESFKQPKLKIKDGFMYCNDEKVLKIDKYKVEHNIIMTVVTLQFDLENGNITFS